MKKVQCPSCGATGVILHSLRPRHNRVANLCRKCKGFGFILMDPAKFAKCKSDARRYRRSTRFLALGECQEFTGLVKVRNIDNVYLPEYVPYGIFYQKHRTPRY